MGILSILGVNKDVEAEVKEARSDIAWIVQTAMASVMGNLTNENGLIPFAINSLDGSIKRALAQLDGWEVDITIGGQPVGKVMLRGPKKGYPQ
jgi:hypothetical protein